MNRNRTAVGVILFLVALSISTPTVRADSLLGTVGAGWQPFPTVLNESGTPYWANKSFDGPNENIGFLMTNSGGFTGSTLGPGPLPFWGNSNGTADLNMQFQRGNTNLPHGVLLATLAAKQFTNSFGWYDVLHPNILHQLFAGPAGPGNPGVTFVPSANYGFYIQEGNGSIFYMDSNLNMVGINTPGDTNHQHFAIFTNAPGNPFASFWLGVTDSVPSPTNIEGLGDYQDLFVEVTPAPIPEPATLTLFGTGLVGLIGITRRRFRRNSTREFSR